MPHPTPVSLRDANQNFSRIIAAVERGEVFCITRRGQEVARLMPSTPVTVPAESPTGGAMSLPGTVLAERMLRLETMMDKLLKALHATDRK